MTMFAKIKKHPLYVVVAVVVIAGGLWYWNSRKVVAAVTQYVTTTVQKQTLISTVSGTGQVSNLKKLDLKPQTSGTTNQGTLTQMNVVPSQKVVAGQVVAVVDDTSAGVALEQARAQLLSAQANYDKIVAGTTQIDLNSSQQDVTSAQSALQNAKTNLDTVTQQQIAAVANSLHSLLSSGIAAVQVLSPYNSPNIAKTDTPAITGSYGGSAQGVYHILQQGSYFSVNGLEVQALQKLNTQIPVTLGTAGLYVQFPNDQISAQWDVAIPNPQGSSYVSNLSSYQSALLSQKQAISNAQNQITTAETNLQKAKDALTQKQEPATASDVANAKAQLINAQSQLRTAQNNYTNTRIVAPFAGVIAAVNSQKGDQVSGSTVVATLVTDQEIATVSLNEVDAAKVKVGDPVTLTFSAIPNLSITGKVSQVDLLGTISQGVVNYNVQIAFDTQDSQVKPGMSASASIITNSVADALSVPTSAVKTSNGQSYVMVIEVSTIATQSGTTVTLNSAPTNQTVEVGVSSDTMTQITNGLTEGQTVVSRTISAQTKTTTGASSISIPGLTGGGGGAFRGAAGGRGGN